MQNQQEILNAREVEDPLTEAMALAPEGFFVEFGVGDGTSLRRLAAKRPNQVLGFDSFDGLPEAWNRLPKGHFAQKTLPLVSGARLVRGLYGPDTLLTKEPCALLHVDCDLYQSATWALKWFAENRVPGAIIVFDEYWAYEGCEDHEQRALKESGIEYEPLFRSHPFGHKFAVRVP